MLFMGLDVGTQGVRGIISDENGEILASHSENFKELNCSDFAGGYEQEPESWWNLVKNVMVSCRECLEEASISPEEVLAISIDGTSGTILPIGKDNQALSPALMYNDMRAKDEAVRTHKEGAELERKIGLTFNASFALPKILWMKEQRPKLHERTAKYIHQADYIVGKLSGIYDVTDYSNALKTGYDLIEEQWPAFLQALDIGEELLPKVVAPGQKIGTLLPKIGQELGFSEKMIVTAGATDGYASALAAGAVKVGDWASIIGTTMVLKGVTKDLLLASNGSSYSHKLPSGAWMLGGAANIGGRCLNEAFNREQFKEMDKSAKELMPTGVISYPLTGTGERFPFVDAKAKAFFVGDISNPKVHYVALMEGVAYAERFAFEQMEEMGAQVGDVIYTAGGACKSKDWVKIRASVLKRELRIPKVVDAAMGATLLAASNTYYSSLEEASEKMISFENVVQPDAELMPKYEELYQKAKREFIKRFQT